MSSKHQIEAKDATIETKEAEIARLKGEIAPAIVDAYAKMRAHAEQMTSDIATMKKQEAERSKVLPYLVSLIERQTFNTVADKMMSLTGRTTPPTMPLDLAFLQTFKYVTDEAERRNVEYEKWASGK
jgi:hypothetical protein